MTQPTISSGAANPTIEITEELLERRLAELAGSFESVRAAVEPTIVRRERATAPRVSLLPLELERMGEVGRPISEGASDDDGRDVECGYDSHGRPVWMKEALQEEWTLVASDRSERLTYDHSGWRNPPRLIGYELAVLSEGRFVSMGRIVASGRARTAFVFEVYEYDPRGAIQQVEASGRNLESRVWRTVYDVTYDEGGSPIIRCTHPEASVAKTWQVWPLSTGGS